MGSSEQILTGISVVGVVLGALVTVRSFLLPYRKYVKSLNIWIDKFRRDWDGEPAEPGRDAVPGVMERLNDLDGELRHNGGSSLKDAVVRLETNFETLAKAVSEIANTQTHILNKLNDEPNLKKVI
jgi:hypothetical protein